MEYAGTIDALIGVCTEIIPLSLDEVGWQAFAAEGVEIAQRRHQPGHRVSHVDGVDDHVAHILLLRLQQLCDLSIQ